MASPCLWILFWRKCGEMELSAMEVGCLDGRMWSLEWEGQRRGRITVFYEYTFVLSYLPLFNQNNRVW
jgi:hypothetical protein